MIEMALAHIDLARLRFAHSPIGEIVASLRVLQERSRQHMYDKWISAVRCQLGGLGADLDLLLALARTGRYLPDFVMPPPTQPWGVLDDELEVVAADAPCPLHRRPVLPHGAVRHRRHRARVRGPASGALFPGRPDLHRQTTLLPSSVRSDRHGRPVGSLRVLMADADRRVLRPGPPLVDLPAAGSGGARRSVTR